MSASSKQFQILFICVLLALQLFLFVEAEKAQRYCGKKLTEKVRDVCNNCVHADGKSKRHVFGDYHRSRRAVNYLLIPVCCIKPCTVAAMEEYCCTDEERQQNEDAKKLYA